MLYVKIVSDDFSLKGTLMQIWKSPNMFESILKSYLENYAFFILINFELFTQEVCVFVKNLARYKNYNNF